ncbi:MAG: hypothetical protein SWO11_22500, partial [Thermodesulfobacteriota bacterium]|nr:hypothetical protein [Thermodesulfobacteriota bacterium]
ANALALPISLFITKKGGDCSRLTQKNKIAGIVCRDSGFVQPIASADLWGLRFVLIPQTAELIVCAGHGTGLAR